MSAFGEQFDPEKKIPRFDAKLRADSHDWQIAVAPGFAVDSAITI